MSKQPAKKRRLNGPTMLTDWLGKSPSKNGNVEPEYQAIPEREKTIPHDENVNQIVTPEKNSTMDTPSKNSKKRKTGFDKTWLKSFPWLKCVNDNLGLLCTICITFKKTPRNGSLIWTSKPCITINLESISKHAKSDAHKEAEQLEAQRILSDNGQGLAQSVEVQSSMERTALTGAFRSIYWLASEEIPHTTKYSSLLGYAKRIGCSYLDCLQIGENVNYESQRTIQDMLQIIAQHIRDPILQDIRKSTYYSILIDETTDIAVMKQMTILARYLTSKNEVKTSFLGMVDLPDGKAETIVQALDKFMSDVDLPNEHLIGLGSDGASVMVGRKSGVAARLKERNPELVNVHCIAHRLALAAAQATDNIPYLKKFKDILQQIFKFYQNSAVRMSGLKEIEAILGGPQLKMKEVLDTRWLSHDRAVTAVRECLPALVASLEREASERSDATAAGLAMFVKNYDFVAAIHMMSDILPHLSRLSKTFQTLISHFKSVGTEQQVLEEWETLRSLLTKECKQMSFRQTLNRVACLRSLYPCLSKLASIGLVLPVSTADCERCFSCLNRVKSPSRNRLCQKVLNCLLTISVEGPEEKDFHFDVCVTEFVKMKKRRISTK